MKSSAFAVPCSWRGAGAMWLSIVAMGLVPVQAAPESAARPLPPTSIYQLAVPLTDQNGRALALDQFRGKPLLVSMFYSSCQFVCPRIVEALKRTEAALPAEQRNRVPILMVTFDTANDDPAALKAMAAERNLLDPIWSLARTGPRETRKLAALLGIQYRELPSGEFNHTSVLILLDAEGRIVGKTFQIGDADPAFVKLVRKQFTKPAPRK